MQLPRVTIQLWHSDMKETLIRLLWMLLKGRLSAVCSYYVKYTSPLPPCSMNGALAFVDTSDCTMMNIAEHYTASDVEWDPTGRYLVTSVSWWSHKVLWVGFSPPTPPGVLRDSGVIPEACVNFIFSAFIAYSFLFAIVHLSLSAAVVWFYYWSCFGASCCVFPSTFRILS